MFTGIIQAVGRIASIDLQGDTARISISAGQLDLGDVALGDSIAVSGPCLTVVEFDAASFAVDVSRETLAKTSLGNKRNGDTVNLEKALRLADRLGGHLVSGHVDGVGKVNSRENLGEYVKFSITAPVELAKYIAAKGSIAVDGVSLTVNEVSKTNFELMLIPHTLQETTLGQLEPGHVVNLEIDLIARYLERFAEVANDATAGSLSETLARSGFMSE